MTSNECINKHFFFFNPRNCKMCLIVSIKLSLLAKTFGFFFASCANVTLDTHGAADASTFFPSVMESKVD